MRGTKRWALQIGPPTPCQPVQFANWVCRHSWQRVGTDNLDPKSFQGKRLKIFDFNLDKVADILKSVGMLVKVIKNSAN